MSRFARLLAHYPYAVLLVVSVVTTTCLVVSITLSKPFDFSKPTAGFEPRGTEISGRVRTFQSIVDNVKETVDLLPYSPSDISIVRTLEGSAAGAGEPAEGGESHEASADVEDDGSVDENEQFLVHDPAAVSSLPWSFQARSYFCALLDKNHARILYKATDGSSLLSAAKLRAICELEEEYFDQHDGYRSACESPSAATGGQPCCRRLSLPNVVAFLAKKPSCRNITDADVSKLYRRLAGCAVYYHNLTLDDSCAAGPKDGAWYASGEGRRQQHPQLCSGLPRTCTQYNLVYLVLHYLTDHWFLSTPPAPRSNPPLTYVASFLPVTAGEANVGLFQHLESRTLSHGGVEVAGAFFDVKYYLFEQYLVEDSVWLALAAAFIFFALWLYTTSIFVTVMTALSIFWALSTAYFLYTFLFEIKFFPYMNLVTIIIMIGIGTDDVYVYCKVWHLAKSEKNNGVLEKIICDTLRHSVLSMLVTSLTTAAAFYANYISDITAIRCFSLYAGTSVVCNFVLTITWMPASIMLYEKWCNFYICKRAGVYTGEFSIWYCVCRFPYKLYYLVCDWSRVFFEQILPCLVIKLRYVWLFLYGGLGLCAVIVIFYYPRLKLPSSKQFQVFSDDHLLEKYDFQLKNMFGFEMVNEEETLTFPITIVWGVHPTDYGDYLNPKDRGPPRLDSSFDLSAAESQVWLLEFCRRLRRTEFYQNIHEIQLTNCFLENFVRGYMKRPCTKDISNKLCCNSTAFPFPKLVFLDCLNHYMRDLPNTLGARYSKYSPGPRFNNGHLTALIVQFQSVERYTHDYLTVSNFYKRVNRWVTEEMLKAPKEMRLGWFVSYLDFFDLQQSLVSGTPTAIGVSLAVVAVVAFFTTLNVLISLYAIVTIACIIMVTIAALVLQGWELNILESVVITVAIGMSIDYTLHYAVAYRLAPDLDREMRVASSISRMGSAVAMAALTTFASGAFMMPSTVLVYRKFGTFLMLLVSVGWVYSTFFFQSLLRLMGPQGGFGQFHWPAFDCCGPSSRQRVDKTIYAFSESTLSSSSANHASMSTEIHELEPLTDAQDSTPRLISHQPLHHCAHHHHHHPHHHHRSRTRGGLYTTVRTSRADAETDQAKACVHGVIKREPVVSFEPRKSNSKDRETDRTCSVSEGDSGVVLPRTDQSPTCVTRLSGNSPSRSSLSSTEDSPELGAVRHSVSANLAHESFSKSVEVL